jgi:hypothetical protein
VAAKDFANIAAKIIRYKGMVMNKKNVLGMAFFVGVLGVVLTGMMSLQPEKRAMQVEPKQYAMGGFPVVPSLRD